MHDDEKNGVILGIKQTRGSGEPVSLTWHK